MDSDNQPASRGDVRRIHERLDTLTDQLHEKFVTMADIALARASHDRDIGELQKQINKHDEWLTWATRLVIGLVIVALVGLVITGKGANL